MELLKQTKAEEPKYLIELGQREVGTLFALMDKNRLSEIQRWNTDVGNEYEQLKSHADWQSLKDLLHSLAIFKCEGIIKDDKVVK